MTGRKCRICESNKTYESKEGYAIWIRYLDNEGKWDRKVLLYILFLTNYSDQDSQSSN